MLNDEMLWGQKYRPRTVSDTILPNELKDTFQEFVNQKNVPNLLLSGSPGTGKTTAAKAMLEEVDCDYIVINGSLNGNIDTLRNDIKSFASAVSLSGGRKYVILDEADYLNPNSTQPALRNFMEEYSKNCGFILTCNFKNRIIEPLHSRCSTYEFNTTKKDLAQLAAQFHKHFLSILDKENVKTEPKAAADLIMKYAPDWRRVLNQAQSLCQKGCSISSIDSIGNVNTFTDLAKYLKAKDFKKMRTWVVNHMDIDTVAIFRGLYDNMNELVVPKSIPQLVLILADYQYKDAFVADHELNTVACLTEIMANVEFK